MWRKVGIRRRLGRSNTRSRRGRHAHIERRDAIGIFVRLLLFSSVTAQMAHNEFEEERGLKGKRMSGGAVMTLWAL